MPVDLVKKNVDILVFKKKETSKCLKYKLPLYCKTAMIVRLMMYIMRDMFTYWVLKIKPLRNL